MNSDRARVLRGLELHGNGGLIELVLKSDARHLREVMSDKAGRSLFTSGGGRRSAMPQSGNPVAEDHRDFIRQVIALLESHRRAGEFDRLVIYAEPEALGNLRHLMPESLRQMVVREVPRNLVHLSPHDLLRTISDELKNGSHVL